MPGLDPVWRLAIITGFLGGLTTFSTFSAEVVELMMRGDYGAGALLAFAHLAGSLFLTFAGFATFRWLTA
jgi:CrcB protein